jgi:flavin-dependent dehydrogenase
MIECDVFIIGGGPAGSIAAAKIVQAGYSVEVVEKVKFPRFVIGESLLPECNRLLEDANMLDTVARAGFQFKGGVTFQNDAGETEVVDFSQNLGQKWGSSFQVRREVFDKLLLDDAQQKGAGVTYESEVVAYDEVENIVTVKDKEDNELLYRAKKVIDASGYGRVLPRLLDLEQDSTLALRDAIFCRMEGDIRPDDGTDGFIYVYVVGDNEAWIWNIPFSDGITSVGIVCTDDYFRSFNMSETEFFDHIIGSNPHAKARYANARKINEVGFIGGYSAAVKTMFGKNYVLAGNASEFLDPVFSSGVTLALESGSKAAELIIKELEGTPVDWQSEYEAYMMVGVNVFREYVNAWYDGRLQTILFTPDKADKITRKIVSILSGYVWDENNMFVTSPAQAVNATYQALTREKV